MVQRKFHHWRKFNLRIKGQMWTSWCCHFVEIHPIAAVMDVRILCHPINRLIGLLSAPAAASFQLLKTPITSIWADNFQSLLPGLLGFVSTLMTPWWRKTSHWRFMEFDWRSRQETSRRERSREGGLHTAAGMGEGGNVICTGQKVRREILTHFLFLLLGWQTPLSALWNSRPSLPPTLILSSPCPVFSFFSLSSQFTFPFRYFLYLWEAGLKQFLFLLIIVFVF